MENKPTTKPQADATNPKGQCHTMSGTSSTYNPPNAGMHSTVNYSVSPTSETGARRFEKT